MSDLVERLNRRKSLMVDPVPELAEAAAEITRLTERVKELEATAWKYLQEVGEQARRVGETERKLDAANSTISSLERRAETAEANIACAVEVLRLLLHVRGTSEDTPEIGVAARAFVEELGK